MIHRIWLFLVLLVVLGCGGADTYSPTFPVPGGPTYALLAANPTQTVAPGTPAIYQLSIRSLDGFDTPVTLSTTGLPQGATAVFAPDSVVPTAAGAPVQLTLNSPSSANFTVVATGGGRSITIPLTLTLSGGGGNFVLAVTPPFREFSPSRNSVTFDVRVSGVGGFTVPVTLSATENGDQIALEFAQTVLNPTPNGAVTTLTVTRGVPDLTNGRGRETPNVDVVITARAAGRADQTVAVVVGHFGQDDD